MQSVVYAASAEAMAAFYLASRLLWRALASHPQIVAVRYMQKLFAIKTIKTIREDGKPVRRLLEWLTSKLSPPRVIWDRMGTSKYLSRWYLTGRPTMPDGSEPFLPDGAPKIGVIVPSGIGVYLHKFHRGDDDQELHNHPWRWSFALILAGGYVEERRIGSRVIRRAVRPGSINVIRGDDFHRVDLIEKDAWSLFVAGPKVSSWGFWNRRTDEFSPWREFIQRKRAGS